MLTQNFRQGFPSIIEIPSYFKVPLASIKYLLDPLSQIHGAAKWLKRATRKSRRLLRLARQQLANSPFGLSKSTQPKTTRLLANSGKGKPVEGQHRWFSYSFKRPLFISRVVVHQTNYPEYTNFQIEATLEDGKTVKKAPSPKSGKVVLDVNDFCSAIKFRPPKAYWSLGTTIESVEIFGFQKFEAPKFIQFARSVDELRSAAIADIERREEVYQSKIDEAEKCEARIADAKKELTTLKGQADRQRSNLRRLDSEKSEITAKLEVLKQWVADSEITLKNLRKELSEKGDRKEGLDGQISVMENKLSDLRANLDIFPSELEDFVKQGSKNTRTLFWLALAPIAVICAMFFLLISGAVDLTTKISGDQSINILALVASRAPYVIVSLAIINACYQIAKFFISELININRQRLSLSKVSIVAKDVANAAETGLELSEIERYGLRVRLKMEMLKDHLRGYVSPDLEIALPKRITSYLPFSGFLTRLDKTEQPKASMPNTAPSAVDPPKDYT